MRDERLHLLPTGVRNTLLRHGFDSLGKVSRHTAEELLALPQFGAQALAEVEAVLGDEGLHLHPSPCPTCGVVLCPCCGIAHEREVAP